MADIVTFTMNPSIDVSLSVERVAPFHKLRCAAERRDPGGGGINVARVMKRFGADVTAMYPIGGALGQLLRRLVDQEGIPGLTTPISGETREDFTVHERATDLQYRFPRSPYSRRFLARARAAPSQRRRSAERPTFRWSAARPAIGPTVSKKCDLADSKGSDLASIE
jgi:hypothetical protein